MEKVQKFHTSANDYSQNKVPDQFVRFAAHALDGILLGVLSTITKYITLLFFSKETTAIANRAIISLKIKELPYDYPIFIILNLFMLAAIFFFVFLKPLMKFGQTFGKRLMKIRLVTDKKEDKRSNFIALFFRETFGKYITLVSYLLIFGFFLYYFKKKFVHDYMFQTTVVKTKEKKSLVSLWTEKV